MAVLADVGECSDWAVRALGRQSPCSLLTPSAFFGEDAEIFNNDMWQDTRAVSSK